MPHDNLASYLTIQPFYRIKIFTQSQSKIEIVFEEQIRIVSLQPSKFKCLALNNTMSTFRDTSRQAKVAAMYKKKLAATWQPMPLLSQN